jgi:hypothetical protein
MRKTMTAFLCGVSITLLQEGQAIGCCAAHRCRRWQ